MNRRVVSIALSAVLVVGVVVAILVGRGGGSAGGGSSGTSSGSTSLITVRGVIGSEKLPFFQDAQVQAAFAAHGYRVQVDTAGSREIATTVDLKKYDFAFPAGAPQGQAIKAKAGARAAYVPFFTPMAIATFKPIADLLTAAGVVRAAPGGEMVLDVSAYLKLVAANKRWSDLAGNTTYPTSRSILISSTDVRKSNSAGMYLSLASYVANGNNIVSGTGQADTVVETVAPLFIKQGFIASSSEEPFQDYLTIGIGKEPLVMIYESQFRGEQIAGNAALDPSHVLLYPSPTVFSKHTLVPLNDSGDAVGQLLLNDPELQHQAVRFGFRTGDTAYMASFAQDHKLAPLPSLVDVVEPPVFDLLERMITAIDRRYQSALATP